MKINFFESHDGLNKKAINGGVYQIELLKKDKKPICLYIGESVWVVLRCGKHLYSLYDNPAYLGLKQEDLDNDLLELKFTLLTSIEKKKRNIGQDLYKTKELEAIKKYKPLTQLQTSDKQISLEDKIKRVQERMKEYGYKEDDIYE